MLRRLFVVFVCLHACVVQSQIESQTVYSPSFTARKVSRKAVSIQT